MEELLEIVILVLGSAPALRLCTRRPWWRLFPTPATALAGSLGVYFFTIAWLAFSYPIALRTLTIVAASVLIPAYWRGRPDYGRTAGLPPGSLGFFSSLESLLDDKFYENQAQRHGPVFKMSQFHRPIVCVLDLQLGHELVQGNETSLTPPSLWFNRFIPRGFIRYMAPADHAIYRRLFQSAFSPRVIESCQPIITESVRDELHRMASSNGPAGVHPQPHMDHMLLVIFVKMFFGISSHSPHFATLEPAFDFLRRRSLARPLTRKVRRVLSDVAQIIREEADRFIDLRQRNEPVPPCFLGEIITRDEELAFDPTTVGNLIYILRMARSDVTGLLVWIFKMLSDHPAWLVRVRDESSKRKRSANGAATRVVMETLRLEQSEWLYRELRNDLRVDRFTIPRGWLLRIGIRECHRSPQVFEHPESFDPARFEEHEYKRSEYSPFGMAQHSCVGVGVTYAVARTLVEELAHGFDWSVVADGPRERGNRHWNHWRPSSNLRVCLASIARPEVS